MTLSAIARELDRDIAFHDDAPRAAAAPMNAKKSGESFENGRREQSSPCCWTKYVL
jgi:hypothetical protein